MIDDLVKIDNQNEEILKLILKKYENFNSFFDTIKEHLTAEELLYDNISVNNREYTMYSVKILKIIDDYFYLPYEIKVNKNLLLYFNELINGKDDFRKMNIIHRHFLHEISDYKVIDSEIDDIFAKFENEKFTTLENYAFLIYHLFKTYPFFNALSIRMIANVYLLKNDYMPFIRSNKFKSEFYYMFQYNFPRFKESFLKLILRSYDLTLKSLEQI